MWGGTGQLRPERAKRRNRRFRVVLGFFIRFLICFPWTFLSKRRCRASLIHSRLFNVLCLLSGKIVGIIVTRMSQLIQTSLVVRLQPEESWMLDPQQLEWLRLFFSGSITIGAGLNTTKLTFTLVTDPAGASFGCSNLQWLRPLVSGGNTMCMHV